MKKVIEFQIGELLGIGMTLVVLGIGVAYGLQIMGETRDDMAGQYTVTPTCNVSGTGIITGCGADVNATVDAIDGLAKIPEKLPTIATVIVASVIIGILVTYLWGRFSNA